MPHADKQREAIDGTHMLLRHALRRHLVTCTNSVSSWHGGPSHLRIVDTHTLRPLTTCTQTEARGCPAQSAVKQYDTLDSRCQEEVSASEMLLTHTHCRQSITCTKMETCGRSAQGETQIYEILDNRLRNKVSVTWRLRQNPSNMSGIALPLNTTRFTYNMSFSSLKVGEHVLEVFVNGEQVWN